MDSELRDEVISAALDGERVDLEALRRALATEDGRRGLAAFVLLRAATAADDIAPATQIDAVKVAPARPRPAWFAGSHLRAACAASIAVLALATSFWFGTTLRAPVSSLTVLGPPAAPAPPPVQIVIVPPTGAAWTNRPPAPVRTTVALSRLRVEPPIPTRVLRFVPGVDWTSTE